MRVIKAFDHSVDGIHPQHLEPGDDPCDVLPKFLPGLVAEGYIADGEPENKVIEGAPETGDAMPLAEAEIHADLEALGVEFDPCDDLATKTALRDQARAQRAEAQAQAAEEPVSEVEAVEAAPETADEADEAAPAVEQADEAADVAEAADGLSEATGQPETAATPAQEETAEAADEADAQPNLTPAQEKALDRDGDGKAGGSKAAKKKA